MLTRLEVNGFKNLADLAVDFGPFTCIAGANGVGKSNVFDAIQFLSLLAESPLMEAAEAVRTTRDERTGDPRDLLWSGASDQTMRFAAEMIVPPEVEDDFGQVVKPSISFLRYELEIGYQAPSGPERRGRLVLLAESLRHINIGEAARRLHFPHSAKEFRRNVVVGRRSGGPFISTRQDETERVITVHQDGGSRGQPRRASATRAPATVVSTITVADDPTVLAARREMQSWRRLALEPSALRTADRYTDPRLMASDGRHLPAALYRIAMTPNGSDPHPVNMYARVASRLSELTGVSLRELDVDADETRELFTLRLVEASGAEIPARSLSEGTLRFLALCVLLEDPDVGGVLCMEEPENGIHPANIPAMLNLLRDLAVDPNEPPGPGNPVRQVVVNTHSPVVVQVVAPDDLLFATSRPVASKGGGTHDVLELRPMRESWRASSNEAKPIGKADLIPYLTTPPEHQISLGQD
ncbi:MAG: AAA family ATPase [Actinomycetota bacterium]|nr:AAA family ATPase [Actinomycetota bacterium]